MFFEFIVNTNCNWNCYYCQFAKIKRTKVTTKEIINKNKWLFEYINNFYQNDDVILIQGGEIGLVDDLDLLEYLFQQFKHKVVVDTNGTFLEKGYHFLFEKYIDKIFYHVVEDPKNLIKVKQYKSNVPIVYGIVGDPKDLLSFIKYNPETYFEYVDVETNNPNFNYADYIDVFDEMMQLPNVNKDKVKEFYDRVNINFKEVQEKCYKRNSFISINLAEEKLVLCTTKANTIGIPLTKENFVKILLLNPIKEKSEFCDTCFRSSLANYNFNKKQYFLRKFLNVRFY